MPRSSFESPGAQTNDIDTFAVGIGKLVRYALNINKAERFKRNFMLKPQIDSSAAVKIRQTLEELRYQDNLDEYISKASKSKTYLHSEGRAEIAKSIRTSGIVNNKVRHKVE